MATVFEAASFHFTPPAELAWARRVLIKPCASLGAPYPVSTSPGLIESIVSGIRRLTDAEILIADGTRDGAPIYPIYQSLQYNFNRVLLLDVKDSIFLEMENPLQEFYASATFWVPNLVLRSDFLISVAPFHIERGACRLSIANLMGLLPLSPRRGRELPEYQGLKGLDIEKVLADLYFTLPFDMGIIEARQRLDFDADPRTGTLVDYGKVLVGEPYEVDLLAARLAGVQPEHLTLIERGRQVLAETA
ncbi:MAG: DUF362 domain-containing protein [Dehalococcoidia bacterium]|jgi:hypothetical protein|nr:DUF362 domain-containing protein [Dehalococcoidia bacterium]